MPFEFLIFGITLVGVAVFHRRALPIAAAGLIAIIAFEWLFSAFPAGPGAAGLAAHFAHEWVILVNLLLLLVGFALLAAHFEESGLPREFPQWLPDDWTGALALLAIVFVLSGFLDNIAAALIGGAMAHTLFRGRVRVGYIAAIVAASNAGGAGSVIGDTTTTMMWISGVPPIEVLHAYIAAAVAFLVFAFPAARAQQRFAPIEKDAAPALAIDWPRVVIVLFILASAVAVNIARQLDPARALRSGFRSSAQRWRPRSAIGRLAAAGLERRSRRNQGLNLPALPRRLGLADASRVASVRVLADRAGARIRVVILRQHSADGAGAEAGRLRLGRAFLCRGIWRIDALVRFVRGRRDLQHVPGSTLDRAVAG